MITDADLVAHRVIPVVVLDEAEHADGLARALVEGGLPVAEVTLRGPGALDVLEAMAQHPGLLVGAGTVLTAAQVDRARDAGAQFVVSPGLSRSVVQRCREVALPVVPGIASATEIMAALELGIDLVKFFPAEANGGLPAVSALASAFPAVRFMPTGGITASSSLDYLAHPAVAAVGGSWMVGSDLLAARDWAEVAARCAAIGRTAGV